MLALKLLFFYLTFNLSHCFTCHNYTSPGKRLADPVILPVIPYIGPIPGDHGQLKKLRIKGVTPADSDGFQIKLQAGPNIELKDDIVFHLSVRLHEGKFLRNVYRSGKWDDSEEYEVGKGRMPVTAGHEFQIVVLPDNENVKIAVDGKHYCEFSYRIPRDRMSHLSIHGNVVINSISWETEKNVLPDVCQVCKAYQFFQPCSR